MPSEKIQFIDIDHMLRLSVMCIENILSIKVKSVFKLSVAAEIYHAHRCLLPESTKHFILIVKNTYLILCLIFGDGFLRLNITFHRMMAVQMIRCNI